MVKNNNKNKKHPVNRIRKQIGTNKYNRNYKYKIQKNCFQMHHCK